MAKPIDTQNLFTKTVEVQKLQQTQQNLAANEQAVFAEEMKKKSDKSLDEVQEPEESVMQETNGEGDGKRKDRNKNKKGDAQDDSAETDSAHDGLRGHKIDIKA